MMKTQPTFWDLLDPIQNYKYNSINTQVDEFFIKQVETSKVQNRNRD